MKRVNQTLLKLDGDPDDPIHVKAFDKAGCLGHRMIRDIEDIDKIPDEEYPLLMESHLDGWEFAVEAWVHDGEIKFLNISEYVTFGYSVFVPATRELESWRNAITKQIEKLIKTFDIKFGQIHPEYFVTSDGEMYFGEVAYRPPGFKAFELIERAYGFNAYQANIPVFDPKSTKEEDAFFPARGRRREGLCRLFWRLPTPAVVLSANLRCQRKHRNTRILTPTSCCRPRRKPYRIDLPSGPIGAWYFSSATTRSKCAICSKRRKSWISTCSEFSAAWIDMNCVRSERKCTITAPA